MDVVIERGVDKLVPHITKFRSLGGVWKKWW